MLIMVVEVEDVKVQQLACKVDIQAKIVSVP
jgi:hypothetical protein